MASSFDNPLFSLSAGASAAAAGALPGTLEPSAPLGLDALLGRRPAAVPPDGRPPAPTRPLPPTLSGILGRAAGSAAARPPLLGAAALGARPSGHSSAKHPPLNPGPPAPSASASLLHPSGFGNPSQPMQPLGLAGAQLSNASGSYPGVASGAAGVTPAAAGSAPPAASSAGGSLPLVAAPHSSRMGAAPQQQAAGQQAPWQQRQEQQQQAAAAAVASTSNFAHTGGDTEGQDMCFEELRAQWWLQRNCLDAPEPVSTTSAGAASSAQALVGASSAANAGCVPADGIAPGIEAQVNAPADAPMPPTLSATAPDAAGADSGPHAAVVGAAPHHAVSLCPVPSAAAAAAADAGPASCPLQPPPAAPFELRLSAAAAPGGDSKVSTPDGATAVGQLSSEPGQRKSPVPPRSTPQRSPADANPPPSQSGTQPNGAVVEEVDTARRLSFQQPSCEPLALTEAATGAVVSATNACASAAAAGGSTGAGSSGAAPATLASSPQARGCAARTPDGCMPGSGTAGQEASVLQEDVTVTMSTREAYSFMNSFFGGAATSSNSDPSSGEQHPPKGRKLCTFNMQCFLHVPAYWCPKLN